MQQQRLPAYRLPTPYLPIYAALALGAGILVGEGLLARGMTTCAGQMLTPRPTWLLLPIMLLPLLWLGRRQRRVLIPAIILLFALLGGWRYLSHPFEPCFGPEALVSYHEPNRYGRPRVMEGVIVSYPVQREKYTQYQVRMDTLWDGEKKLPVSGDALVRADVEAPFRYGDRVRIRGVPETPPSFPDFDYRRYLARKGVYTLVRRADLHLLATGRGNPILAALYAVRARASTLLTGLMPQPYAALANGMILGIESGIPRELYGQFNLTGTSHVIVISGSNIAIVSGILLLIFTFFLHGRKKAAAVLSLVGIGLYTLLVGADAAVVRAAIMGGLYVLAIALDRQSAAIITLFIAALVMLLLNPLTLWDVGFQLSFMATLGLILFSTPLQELWNERLGKRLPGPINNILAEGLLITLAAQITTMPMVVYYFGRFSIVSFLANLLILPVQPPIMIVGGLAIMLAAIFAPLGQLIALIPLASLWWTVLVVQKLAAIPWGSIKIGAFGRLLSALYYLCFLAAFLWWLLRREQNARHLIPAWLQPALTRSVLAAGLAIIPLWMGATALAARPDGDLHIRLLGLEDNVAWLITTPGGNRALVWDGRESAISLPNVLAAQAIGPKSLHLFIDATVRDAPSSAQASISAQTIVSATADLPPGAVIQLDQNVQITSLPVPENEPPLFRLAYRHFSLLLPFANSQQTQTELLHSGVLAPVTLLITPWPGTGAWPLPALLASLHPQMLLQPEGCTYPPGVQAELETTPARILIPNDAITEISSDGYRFEMRRRAYSADVPRE